MVHMRTVNSVATPDRGSGMAHQLAYRVAVGGKHPASKIQPDIETVRPCAAAGICRRRVFCGRLCTLRQPRPIRAVRRHGRPTGPAAAPSPSMTAPASASAAARPMRSAGPTWTMTLTCASDAYKFNLAANVVDQGGAVSGTWSESQPQRQRHPAGPRRRRQFPGRRQRGRLQCQHLAAHHAATSSRSRCGPTASSAAPISRCRSKRARFPHQLACWSVSWSWAAPALLRFP